MDWDNSYYTMSEGNNYAIWAFLKKCHEKGLIYKGFDVMPWCPRCGTGISQMEMNEGYRVTSHLSVFCEVPHKRTEERELARVDDDALDTDFQCGSCSQAGDGLRKSEAGGRVLLLG